MIQVINRALRVLDTLPEKEEGFGVLELAERLGLPNATVHRILATLKKEGYVIQDPSTEKYKLGPKILTLAKRVLENQNLRQIALPYLKELKETTGETAHLIILEGEEAICVESVESSNNMRMCSPVGEKNPLHCTAVGKVLLAYLPEEARESFLEKPLTRYTPNTLTSPEELRRELEKIRRDGYALDREEYQVGVRCIAAPIIDSGGKVPAAVGISYPSFRVTKEKEKEFIHKVKEVAFQISRDYEGY